jgi:hypothetical protein
MLSPKPILKPKQRYPQHQNDHNNPQMEIVMQQMMEVHTGIMRVMTSKWSTAIAKSYLLECSKY